MKIAEPAFGSGWQARLALRFARDERGTRLRGRTHQGPLVVQRPFYPEGSEVCQTVILHPPGGIAGGDSLEIELQVEDRAKAQLTTPGATKWYRAFDRTAAQRIAISVAPYGLCEWLPQENIVFDAAQARTSLDVAIAASATYCGWEFTCLGRPESGLPFAEGVLQQSIRMRIDGTIVFHERALICPGSEALAGPGVLGGHVAYGTLIVAGPTLIGATLDRAREIVNVCPTAGMSAMDRLLVARWVGNRIEEGRALFTSLWAMLRPWYAHRMAVVPRIWAT
jgi:urease accessory protein